LLAVSAHAKIPPSLGAWMTQVMNSLGVKVSVRGPRGQEAGRAQKGCGERANHWMHLQNFPKVAPAYPETGLIERDGDGEGSLGCPTSLLWL
jgi:hypothetical protein